MKTPVYVRPLTDAERQALEAGLRSSDAFVLRRCQIILSSACGKRVPAIAKALHCDDDTVLKAIHAFNARGLAALTRESNRPHKTCDVFDAESLEGLRALLHRSPRHFDKPKSLWTLDLVADVSFEQGLTAGRVSRQTIANALSRLGVGWRRAKRWITSPDPEYARKKELGIGC
jgi:transposase